MNELNESGIGLNRISRLEKWFRKKSNSMPNLRREVDINNFTNIFRRRSNSHEIKFRRNMDFSEIVSSNIATYINELNVNGYTVIPNVFNDDEIGEYWNEFNEWRNQIPDLDYLHSVIDYNGIYKHHQVGHQRFAWLARTNPKIINIFKQLWNTDDLVAGFDGCCHYPSDYIGESHHWVHTDQSSRKKGVHCYQSFLSLTNNSERTFIVYKGSHLLHETYFEETGIDAPDNWHIFDKDYIDTLEDRREILEVRKGDLVIWDSRTYHQNTCGTPTCEEERLIQYLCYLPKYNEENTEDEQKKRKKAFDKLSTTAHWPYPMKIVPEQANYHNYIYPDNQIYIDYNSLPSPNLDDLMSKIETLI